MDQRKRLRQSLCQQRAELPRNQQRQATEGLCENLQMWFNGKFPGSLGAYLAVRGEIDPNPLLVSVEPDTTIYLPVITEPKGATPMRFAPWTQATALRKGRYNIDVPDVADTALVDGMSLDTILVPMVAFDAMRNRMGMGGGYYDRTFSRRLTAESSKPQLIGVAHDFQCVDMVPAEHWDIPMDVVITDKQIYT